MKTLAVSLSCMPVMVLVWAGYHLYQATQSRSAA